MSTIEPIAARIFVESDGVGLRLLAGRRVADGRLVFPFPAPGADAGFEPYALSDRGGLWSFTVQRFRPKSPPYAGPEQFEPYAVGYIELPGEVIVESRLVGVTFEDLHIGMPMRLTTETLDCGDGALRLGFAFTFDEAAS